MSPATRRATGVLALALAALSASFVEPGAQQRPQDPGPEERAPDRASGPDRARPASAPISPGDRNDPGATGDRSEGPSPGAVSAFRVSPGLDHAFSHDEIAAFLANLAVQHPDLAKLESIGRSRSGRDIPMLTITDPAGGAADEKPALLVADFRAAGSTYGAEACLGFAARILERARTEPEIARLLADHTIYLAPALAPDERVATDAPARDVLFDRNFPLGWRPASLRPGSGDYPLSEPETLAAASFLGRCPNLVAVVGAFEPRAAEGAPWHGAELPEEDRAAFGALCRPMDEGDGGEEGDEAGPQLRPWSSLGSPGGGFFDYAYQALGAYPVAWAPPEATDPVRLAAWVDRVARRVGDLLRLLPTLRIEQGDLVEIAPGLWQLDVAIRNEGRLPTMSALGRRRQTAGDLALSLGGARVVATAHRAAGEAAYRDARLHGDAGLGLGVGVLGGGETRWLRVILEGEAGATLEVTGAAARGGRAALAVTLR